MSVIRAFIAIELSTEIQQALEQVSNQLKGQLGRVHVRWVPVKNIHLTLKFLGDVSQANLEVLEGILLGEAARCAPFEVSIGKLGAFPSTRRPRVIWVGVEAPAELGQLQHALDEATARLGYPLEERGFSPHLTLGRISRNASNEEVRRIGQYLEGTNVGRLGAMQVQDVKLYRSDLQPTGAVYTCLYSANLKVER
jgi:2'-5' RNA ligase